MLCKKRTFAQSIPLGQVCESSLKRSFDDYTVTLQGLSLRVQKINVLLQVLQGHFKHGSLG